MLKFGRPYARLASPSPLSLLPATTPRPPARRSAPMSCATASGSPPTDSAPAHAGVIDGRLDAAPPAPGRFRHRPRRTMDRGPPSARRTGTTSTTPHPAVPTRSSRRYLRDGVFYVKNPASIARRHARRGADQPAGQRRRHLRRRRADGAWRPSDPALSSESARGALPDADGTSRSSGFHREPARPRGEVAPDRRRRARLHQGESLYTEEFERRRGQPSFNGAASTRLCSRNRRRAHEQGCAFPATSRPRPTSAAHWPRRRRDQPHPGFRGDERIQFTEPDRYEVTGPTRSSPPRAARGW